MRFTIRTALVADVPAMHRVRTGVQENRLANPRRVTEASYLPFIAGGSAWVAEADGSIAGFGVIGAPAKHVWALFVDPVSEGAGIGQALLQRMLEWARVHDIGHLSLTTSPGTRAEQFYARAGWIKAGFTADGEVRLERTLLA